MRQTNAGPRVSSAAVVVASFISEAGLMRTCAWWLSRGVLLALVSTTMTWKFSLGTLARCSAASTSRGNCPMSPAVCLGGSLRTALEWGAACVCRAPATTSTVKHKRRKRHGEAWRCEVGRRQEDKDKQVMGKLSLPG